MYYCDNTYSKENEIGINPMEIIPKIVELKSKDESTDLYNLVKMFKTPENFVLSKKDIEGKSYKEFMDEVSRDYQ